MNKKAEVDMFITWCEMECPVEMWVSFSGIGKSGTKLIALNNDG